MAAASLSRELKRTSPNVATVIYLRQGYRDSYTQTRLASILPSLLPCLPPPRSVNFIFGIVSS